MSLSETETQCFITTKRYEEKYLRFRFSKSLFEKEKVCVWSMKVHLFIPLYDVSLKGLPQILFLSILGNAGERIVYILERTGNVHYLIL